jgi:hypothetical protein
MVAVTENSLANIWIALVQAGGRERQRYKKGIVRLLLIRLIDSFTQAPVSCRIVGSATPAEGWGG